MSAARSRSVVLLGSTGSIGTQALEVIAANPDRFRATGLAAGGKNLRLLAEQVLDAQPEFVALARDTAVGQFGAVLAAAASDRSRPAPNPVVTAGPDAVAELAAMPCDVVLNGITGSVGLQPTLRALAAGNTVALANKESLVAGGPLVKRIARPGQLIPVDSEHSAIAQCLRGGTRGEVSRLILTASGGPFRGRAAAELHDVTPQQALAHPTWDMGPVVTVNSATLINKGLELIEAHVLFEVPYERIEVVVHPQSVVHSMVEFTDGSILAQASPPDMRLPIALGLAWPDRIPGAARACDWTAAVRWQFEPLDADAFPAVGLARAAGQAGGTMPAVLNAANEECVRAFLAGALRFPGITGTIARVLDVHGSGGDGRAGSSLADGTELSLPRVLAAEAWARTAAGEIVRGRCGATSRGGSA